MNDEYKNKNNQNFLVAIPEPDLIWLNFAVLIHKIINI